MTQDDNKEKRRVALEKCFGLWKDRKDIPSDGLEYERQLRQEWEREDCVINPNLKG